MTGALLVCGTASDAGKSVLVAGICRYLRRQGVAVAPFKAQNMALNSAVTAAGEEIGRAQAAQAAACGIPAEAAMNPVLLKPTGEATSQVVVMGRPAFTTDAASYPARHGDLLPVVLDALADLRRRFEVVVCEGAGSPAEINLRAHDLANMGLARAAGLPVVLVGPIDRGGVFAALHGTVALLDPDDQRLVAGFVINRFRGDARLLEPGLRQLTDLTGRPVLGVVPHTGGIALDAEDSLALERPPPVTPPQAGDVLRVAVVRLPRISNFTDADPLTCEPGVAVSFTADPAEVAAADLAVVPGSKHTVADLDWLRARGLDQALADRAAAGRPVLGVCGGYQMLGGSIDDRVESRRGCVAGLGLLPVDTRFAAGKVLARRSGSSPRFGGAAATGYEIRHGRVTVRGGQPWLARADGTPEGCAAGAVLGTSWHGLLEGDDLRRRLLGWVATTTGRDWRPGTTPFRQVREARLDRLADLVAAHLDTAALARLIHGGTPPGLPTVPPAGGAARPAPVPEVAP